MEFASVITCRGKISEELGHLEFLITDWDGDVLRTETLNYILITNCYLFSKSETFAAEYQIWIMTKIVG